jgi:ATPase subunit of ABC transporter with duplicated ATPase domains
LESLSFRPEQWRLGLDALSGGEQNLALLARALVADPDLLLMDEPGNHMNVVALAHLQRFLSVQCPCPFLLIAHDRELLDSTCNRTVFWRDKILYSFDLPYEKARAALADHDAQAWHQRQAETREIKRLQVLTRAGYSASSEVSKTCLTAAVAGGIGQALGATEEAVAPMYLKEGVCTRSALAWWGWALWDADITACSRNSKVSR